MQRGYQEHKDEEDTEEYHKVNKYPALFIVKDEPDFIFPLIEPYGLKGDIGSGYRLFHAVYKGPPFWMPGVRVV